jgi:hypothetical protein
MYSFVARIGADIGLLSVLARGASPNSRVTSLARRGGRWYLSRLTEKATALKMERSVSKIVSTSLMRCRKGYRNMSDVASSRLKVEGSGEDVFAFDSSFTVWQIDVESAATKALHTYQGHVFSVQFSPDRQRLAFYRQTAPHSNNRELYLADVFSGEALLYRSGYLLDFVAWHPDAIHFLLQVGDDWQMELGHL